MCQTLDLSQWCMTQSRHNKVDLLQVVDNKQTLSDLLDPHTCSANGYRVCGSRDQDPEQSQDMSDECFCCSIHSTYISVSEKCTYVMSLSLSETNCHIPNDVKLVICI